MDLPRPITPALLFRSGESGMLGPDTSAMGRVCCIFAAAAFAAACTLSRRDILCLVPSALFALSPSVEVDGNGTPIAV